MDPAQAGQDPRVLSATDTLRLNQLGGPTLSPDGEWVLYTQRTRDMEDDQLEARTQVWRVRVDGTARRQLTHAISDSRAPAWSPDGALLLFLARGGETDEEEAALDRAGRRRGGGRDVPGHAPLGPGPPD